MHSKGSSSLGAGGQDCRGSPGHQSRAWQPGPVPFPSQEQLGVPGQPQPQAPGTSPARGQPRPGQVVGPWVGLARQGPWLGRAGLWGAGDQPCCSITGAGADGPREATQGPGPWAGGESPRGLTWGSQGRWCPQDPDNPTGIFELSSP